MVKQPAATPPPTWSAASLLQKIFNRNAAPQPLENEPNADGTFTPLVNKTPRGTSGTQSFAGYNYEEYLQTLRGRKRADIFDQMRRSDSQIKMCLSAVKNPLRSSVKEIVPGDVDSPEAKKQAEFIEHVLFHDMEKTFDETFNEMLTFVDFGFSLFEITDKVVLNDEKYGTYNGIQSLGWRSPRTIERWNVDGNGKLVNVTQWAQGDLYRFVDIPAEFLLCFSLDKEGDNYEGVSWLRAVYGNWFRKNTYLKLNAIGIEKYAIPTPMAEVPDQKQDSDEYKNLVDVLENFVSHQKQFITYPKDWKIDLKPSVFDPAKVEASVDAEDKRIAKAFLANFLELGLNGTGAFALSNDLSNFMLAGLQQLANIITGVVNKVLIPRIIQLNFGPQKTYPRLKISGITDKFSKELADMLVELAGGKFITPLDEDEIHIRKRLDLDQLPEDKMRKNNPTPVVDPNAPPATPVGGVDKKPGEQGSAGGANDPAPTFMDRIRAEQVLLTEAQK